MPRHRRVPPKVGRKILSSDPIRLSDLRESQPTAPSVSRHEAKRQFNFSFALVVILTLGTLAAAVIVPKERPQVALVAWD